MMVVIAALVSSSTTYNHDVIMISIRETCFQMYLGEEYEEITFTLLKNTCECVTMMEVVVVALTKMQKTLIIKK